MLPSFSFYLIPPITVLTLASFSSFFTHLSFASHLLSSFHFCLSIALHLQTTFQSLKSPCSQKLPWQSLVATCVWHVQPRAAAPLLWPLHGGRTRSSFATPRRRTMLMCGLTTKAQHLRHQGQVEVWWSTPLSCICGMSPLLTRAVTSASSPTTLAPPTPAKRASSLTVGFKRLKTFWAEIVCKILSKRLIYVRMEYINLLNGAELGYCSPEISWLIKCEGDPVSCQEKTAKIFH